jgi:hypothetical protein
MEQIWKNFDEKSKIVVKELTQDNQKLSKLVSKLQNARMNMDTKAKLMEALTQEVKK